MAKLQLRFNQILGAFKVDTITCKPNRHNEVEIVTDIPTNYYGYIAVTLQTFKKYFNQNALYIPGYDGNTRFGSIIKIWTRENTQQITVYADIIYSSEPPPLVMRFIVHYQAVQKQLGYTLYHLTGFNGIVCLRN